jgi:hypothetical protein
MRYGNAFKSTNRNRMSSNAYTDQNQGGGDKKAGFPHTVGRDHWTSIYMGAGNNVAVTGRCCSLTQLQITANPNVCQSRPIGSTYHFNSYWRCR